MRKLGKRIISFLLVFIMITGMVPLFALTVFANDEEEEVIVIQDYTTLVYENIDAMLADMGRGPDGLPTGRPELIKDGYELYYNHESGAVAIKDLRTNQVITTNPYDVGSVQGPTPNIKAELLSQIVIRYMDADKAQFFNSYTHAALNNQIKMKPIRGGIRVEYTIGREEKRMLVPRMLPAVSFEENIMEHVPEGRARQKLEAYYSYKDAQAPDLTERAKRELQVKFPVTSRFPIYVFDPNASRRELAEIEGYIREFSPYTFEQMDEDHRETDYTGSDRPPPLFKMALEYYIEEDGLRVRLPANGIRFDESNYQVDYIMMLPYMGAIRRENIGYTFVPDGSGALVRSEDIGDTDFTFMNRLYGQDFSFFDIRGGHATQRWTMPVFGAVEEHSISRTFIDEIPEEVDVPAVTEDELDDDGNVIGTIIIEEATTETVIREVGRIEVEERTDGFLAIIEEGDAMAQIRTDHGGPLHPYNSTGALFTPRPTDQYQLDTDATGLSSMITVASRRRYTGNYMIRYIMLSDNTNPDYRGEDRDRTYEATWVGMAKAYREYLEKNGGLTRMADTGGDIPLFLETLGLMWTSEYFLGFPYQAQTPLTSFEDVKSMIDELNAEGISNLNFRMRGWNNGGLGGRIGRGGMVPTTIRIHRTMGGADGLRDLFQYADSKNATVYPDIEIGLVWSTGAFNGFNHRRDFARTMSDQFAHEQHYFFLFQMFMGRFAHNIVSASRMENIYNLSMRHFERYNPHAISVASLSRELHSDQNRRNLVNRQEAQGYVTEVLGRAQEDHGRVLGLEANAFAWQYLDATLGVPLDASRMMKQSEAVPFYGMVTHGYLDIAGTPINMAGDIKYDILKAIENGSNPYFVVAYQNASRLKEDFILAASFFSVNYQTWFPEIVRIYHLLNDNLRDIRYKLMVDHEFLDSNIMRVTYDDDRSPIISERTENTATVVRVVYEGGVSFILNYNNEYVDFNGHLIPPLEFIRLN